jgi:serine/threonine protein kinase
MEWKADVQILAQLSHPNLSAVKGYCTHERVSNRERRQGRLLVFEQASNGTLHDHLFGPRGMSSLDWTTRIDIALGAARGLSYIHDRAPLQIAYKEFKAANVLLDEDYSPKLAGYGLSVIPANRHSSVRR